MDNEMCKNFDINPSFYVNIPPSRMSSVSNDGFKWNLGFALDSVTLTVKGSVPEKH